MGKYSEYGKRVETIVKESFADLQKATDDYDKARKERSDNPIRSGWGVSLEQQIKAKQADLAFQEAQRNLDEAKKRYRENLGKIKAIREELKAVVSEDLLAEPKALDRNTVDLLSSGICSPSEIVRLYEKAESVTMKRYISRFAREEAKRIENAPLDPARRTQMRMSLNEIVQSGKNLTDADNTDALRAFDCLSFVAERTMNNPALSKQWNELTDNAMKSL